MAVKSDVKTGHDIAYVTRGHTSGCAGAMAYYTRSGDPPGTWEGRGAAALGLAGTVQAEVAERLYQEGVGPAGERIIRHAASAGSSASTTSHPVTPSSSSAGTAARATATPSASASPGRGLLGVLPVPAGATPWPENTNALMSRVSFKSFYIKSAWTEEEALYTRRGFVSAVEQGWDNADGSQQFITLVRFATQAGAMSAFDEVRSGWKPYYPSTMLADPAIGAVGWSSPRLDSAGDAEAEFGVAVGDTLISVVEYTAATPDPAAAKALLQQQYDSSRTARKPGSSGPGPEPSHATGHRAVEAAADRHADNHGI